MAPVLLGQERPRYPWAKEHYPRSPGAPTRSIDFLLGRAVAHPTSHRGRGCDVREDGLRRFDDRLVDDQQMALTLALLEEDEPAVHRRSGREGGSPIRHPLAVDANAATGQRPSCITPR